jgi:hypothetical protein
MTGTVVGGEPNLLADLFEVDELASDLSKLDHSRPSPRHARKHAVPPYQRVKERGRDMEKDGREEQKCENRVGAAQEGIKLVIMRHNLRQMDRSTENDRIATSRKHRPTDHGHDDQQGVEKVVGCLSAYGLPKRQIRRQRWYPAPQPHAETEYGKQQDRDTQGPMDCDERQKFGLQRRDHPDADKQHGENHGRHQPMQRPLQRSEILSHRAAPEARGVLG